MQDRTTIMARLYPHLFCIPRVLFLEQVVRRDGGVDVAGIEMFFYSKHAIIIYIMAETCILTSQPPVLLGNALL